MIWRYRRTERILCAHLDAYASYRERIDAGDFLGARNHWDTAYLLSEEYNKLRFFWQKRLDICR